MGIAVVMVMVLVGADKEAAVEKFAGCKTSLAQAEVKALCNPTLGQMVAK